MSDPSTAPGILALEGDIDLYQSPVVKGKLDELIGRKTGRILVDMSRVNYIDSSGLALFGVFGLLGPFWPSKTSKNRLFSDFFRDQRTTRDR